MGPSEIRRAPSGAGVQVDEDDHGPFKTALGEEVVAQRKELGLTQAALAKAASCARQTLHLLETGVRMPSTQLLCRIAAALDLELADLVAWATERMSAPIPPRSGAEQIAGLPQ
jgi:transcriptional regulator with XRE-family HTH domain